jgi:hypothetical protein
MMNLKYYSEYVTDGSAVFCKDREFPLTPIKHPVKQFDRYFMTSDRGTSTFLGKDDIQRYVEKPIELEKPEEAETKKSRGKSVSQKSTGKKFDSMKQACEQTGFTLAQLKKSGDFIIA